MRRGNFEAAAKRKRGGRLLCILLAAGVGLSACATPPEQGEDLEIVARPGAALPGERTRRMPPSLAATPFGTVVARAVQDYPSLAAGTARMRAAEAAIAAERGAFLPQVSIGAETGVRLIGGTSSTRATPVVSVEQLLYDGGAASARTRAAQARLAQSASDRLGAAASLTYDAVQAYHEVLHRRRLLELAGRNLTLHRDFVSQTEARVQAGAASETDLLTAQSRLADATARHVTAQSRLDRAEAGFRELFGIAPASIAAPAAAPALPANAATVEQSPRLRSVDAAIAGAQAELQAARAGANPSVVLNLTGGSANGRADVNANLGLRYDLATGGRRQAAIRSAEARVQELESSRAELVRQIERALDVVRSDQRAGAERLRAARLARRANEANVEAVREQFTIGRRSITELLDAQRDFLTASEALLEAELELALSGYAALSLTGDIVDVFGISLPDAATPPGGAALAAAATP